MTYSHDLEKAIQSEKIYTIWEQYDADAKVFDNDFYEAIEAFDAFYIEPNETNREHLIQALRGDKTNENEARKAAASISRLSLA